MFALISNGVVANVIRATPDFIAEYEHGYDQAIECGAQVGIGWYWNETDGFTPPVVPTTEVPPTE